MDDFKKVAVLGPGLLGGSILLGIHERSLPSAASLSVWSRRIDSIEKIQGKNVVRLGTTDIARLFENPDISPDLIILATPIGFMPGLARSIAEHATHPAVITDVGSTKGKFVDELEIIFETNDNLKFVSSHPMAGSEKTGFENADPNLFQDKVCILTPTAKTDPTALMRVDRFWKSLGSTTHQLTPEEHDAVVAKVSHIPHIAAAAIVLAGIDETTARIPTREFAANGFKDTTRIAGGCPDMWTEILLENRLSISESLRDLILQLESVQESLENSDETSLHEFLASAKEKRDSLEDL